MKKYYLGVFAVVMAFAAMSFSQIERSKATTFYYEYLGSTSDLSDYQNPNNWVGPIAQGSTGCQDSNLPCEVMSSVGDKAAFVNGISSTSDVDNNISAWKP